jgi:hypothetical protein
LGDRSNQIPAAPQQRPVPAAETGYFTTVRSVATMEITADSNTGSANGRHGKTGRVERLAGDPGRLDITRSSAMLDATAAGRPVLRHGKTAT